MNQKKSLKHSAYRSLSRLCRWLDRPQPAEGLRALLYHAVGSRLPEDPYGTSLSAEMFAEHMAAIAARRGAWEPVPFGRPAAGRRQLAITFDDGYRDTLTAAAPLLVRLGLPFAVFVTAGHVRAPSSLYLSPAELKELAALPGVLIGAHGDAHRPLDALGEEALRRELSESRKYLEDILGRAVTALSYPHGGVNRRVRDAAEEAGYVLGGTSRYGLNGPDRDPLLLCRTEVTAWDDREDVALKLDGHWDWFALRHFDPSGAK